MADQHYSSDEQQPSGPSEALGGADRVTHGSAAQQAPMHQQGAPAHDDSDSAGLSEGNLLQRGVPAVSRGEAVSESLQPDGQTDGREMPQPSSHHFSLPLPDTHPPAAQWPFGHPAAPPSFPPPDHLAAFPPAGYPFPSLANVPLSMQPSCSYGQLPFVDPLMAGAPPPILPTEGSLRQRASSLPPPRRQRSTKEVAIGEREALLAEFDSRRAQGEKLTQLAFALEKGITLSQFKHWRSRSTAGSEAQDAIDKAKKRIRQSPYQPIEAELRQWMAGHEDPTRIPVEHIRREALEIAGRLGISGFKASDTWISGVKKRYNQSVTLTDQPLAAAAAAASALPAPPIDTDGMIGEQHFNALPQEGIHTLRGADASDDTQGALKQTDQSREDGQSVSAAAAASFYPPMHPLHLTHQPDLHMPIPLTHQSAAAAAAAGTNGTDGMATLEDVLLAVRAGLNEGSVIPEEDAVLLAPQLDALHADASQSDTVRLLANDISERVRFGSNAIPGPHTSAAEEAPAAAATAPAAPSPSPVHPPHPHPLPVPLINQPTQGELSNVNKLSRQSTESDPAPLASRERLSDQQGQVVDESAAVRVADGFIGRRPNDRLQIPPAADGDRSLHRQSQYSTQEAHVPAAAAAASAHPPSPIPPPHPHPPPRPLTHQSAADALRLADGFIGPTAIYPPDDDAAAVSDRPLDQQSLHSGRNTMSMTPSESRLTNESPFPASRHKPAGQHDDSAPPTPCELTRPAIGTVTEDFYPPSHPEGCQSALLLLSCGDRVSVTHTDSRGSKGWMYGTCIKGAHAGHARWFPCAIVTFDHNSNCEQHQQSTDIPLDQQSQTSGRNTMSMVPSESRLTNERPPAKIHKDENRSHREGPPSVVWSRSSVKSVFTVTADDRLSDIPEDDGDVISISDGAAADTTALSTGSTTDEDDQSHDPQMVVGSSLSESECAALRSLFVPSVFDECEFSLLYRASRDGPLYGDLLRCVDDANRLVFIIRKDKYVFGAFISGGIRLPDDPKGEKGYCCHVRNFSLAGHFNEPTKMGGGIFVWVAGRDGTVNWGGKLEIDGLRLGCEGGAVIDMRSCRQSIAGCLVPDGYVGVRDEYGDAVFGGSEYFMADEVEVICVDGRSLLSLKVMEGADFDPLQSAALYRFVGRTAVDRLKLIYRATRDGPSFDDFLRCVGDTKGLVFVIRKDKYVFGVYMSAGIQLPHDPKGYNDYSCYVYDFSLSGHFEKPTKMLDDRRLVYVAGREGTVGKLRIDGIGGCLCLGYGTADDMRSCRQSIPRQYVPEGYVGVRDDRGNAVFGGSEHFMADEIEVLTVV
ncbi:unnamed protein product [Vitrella brassicaformis CCMP3155]|uniref:Oxidation resistance protein 1 n=1 Tax=Vitrella brassicaformis (strain CCMP3155) TaxID=1169540 RepID=A0A0G4ENE3_VITBC|nr:unnamed protein product [Vitrella brassicaformis CCMP3155]|eukprot:CEL98351.1 unnamed protein product [Vitrella brassicaformis CCMP3155]